MKPITFSKMSGSGNDFIIIDNAPVPVVTDGLIVGNLSDISLFVLRLNYTPRNNIKFINQIAKNGDLKNIYMILNGVKPKRFGYYRIYGKNGYYKDQKRSKEKTNKSKSAVIFLMEISWRIMASGVSSTTKWNIISSPSKESPTEATQSG